MTPSLEGWPTKAKEAPSPREVRLAPLDINPVFQNLGEDYGYILCEFHIFKNEMQVFWCFISLFSGHVNYLKNNVAVSFND